MQQPTFAQCFERALEAEKFLRDTYTGLAASFSYKPEVASFWREMALDEVQHAKRLDEIYRSLGCEKLDAPAILSDALVHFVNGETLSAAHTLAHVVDLEDAFELAVDLENREINDMFVFLMQNFLPLEGEALTLVLSMLEDHIQKVIRFSDHFGGLDDRRLIRAIT